MQQSKFNKYQNVKKNGHNHSCKICFRTDSDMDNPLISPCNCSGSMRYIHYKCLKLCINSKIKLKESENFKFFILKNYECEICLKEYPKYLKYKNIIYNMIDFGEIKFEDYLIFDYYLTDFIYRKKNNKMGILIVGLKNNEFITIGRNPNNTIRLKEISVSRNHCSIYKKDNKIFISNIKSRFGTLLYLNKPYILSNENMRNINISDNTHSNKNNSRKNFQYYMSKGNNSNSIKSIAVNENKNKEINFNYCLMSSSVSLISGKNRFEFKFLDSRSLLESIFGGLFCCKLKYDNDKNEENKDIKSINIIDSKTNDNFDIINYSPENILNDSFIDYYLNVDHIIISNDNTLDEGFDYENNN